MTGDELGAHRRGESSRASGSARAEKRKVGEEKMWLKMGRFRGLEDGPERDQRDGNKGVRTDEMEESGTRMRTRTWSAGALRLNGSKNEKFQTKNQRA